MIVVTLRYSVQSKLMSIPNKVLSFLAAKDLNKEFLPSHLDELLESRFGLMVEP